MASSEVQICNMALGRIGNSIFIDSLSESSVQADVCNLFYEPCRDLALSAFDWNFARKRAVLADLGTPPTNWAYRYAVPTDCLAARFVVIEGSRTPLAKDRIPFEVASEDDALVLYTDLPEAELVYTRRMTNPNLFSASFVMALSWLIGSEIALPLSAAPGLGERAFKMYNFAISQSQAASLNEAQEDVEPDSEFISGRN